MAATLCGCVDARFVGVSPSESMVLRMRRSVPPGEKMVARMRGLWVFPRMRMMKLFNVFGLILLYKTGINIITQEALSTPGIL